MTKLRLIVCGLPAVIAAAGCSLFDGYGDDSSKLIVDHRCKVTLNQAARVGGKSDADVVESVTVSPTCEAQVEFRQVTGEGVEIIESQSGTEVLQRHEDLGD